MAPKTGTRRAQVTSRGLGKHFESPKRPRDKRQTQHMVEIPGQTLKRRRLLERLEELQRKSITDAVQENDDILSNDAVEVDINDFTADLDPGDEDYVPSDVEPEIVEDAHEQTSQGARDLSHGTETQTAMPRRRVLPDAPAERLYANWKVLIPTLVSPYLHYMSRTLGKPLSPNPQSISLCKTDDCPRKSTKLLALLFDRKLIVLPRFRSLRHSDFVTLEVASCECSTVAQVLLHFGFFPTAPSQPRMAVSVDLLAFYRALFERSCDAVNALASALHTHYIRRGFRMVNKNVRACLSVIVRHSTQKKTGDGNTGTFSAESGVCRSVV